MAEENELVEESATEEGIADEESLSEEADSQETETEDSDAHLESSDTDWWDTTGLDEKAASRIKNIQREYNNKSETLKKHESDIEAVKSAYNELVTQIRGTLASPDYLKQIEHLRSQMAGFAAPQDSAGAPPKMPEIKNQADLEAYHTGPYAKWLLTQAKAEMARTVYPVQNKMYQDSWTKAHEAMTSSEDFGAVYQKHAQAALSEAVKISGSLSQQGKSEAEILQIALLNIPAARNEILSMARQKTLESVKAKKAAGTERAKGKKQAPKKSGKQTSAEIVAELEAQGYSLV